MLFKRRGHSGLSIRTVCTDRKGSFRSVYDRKIASHFGVLDFNHVLFERRVTTVCPSVPFERIVNAVYSPYTVRQMHLIKCLKQKKL